MKPSFPVKTAVAAALTVVLAAGVVVFPIGPAQAAGKVAVPILLDRLVVVEEPPRVGYNRDLFPHWSDSDGDGCDTRREVLFSESLKGMSWCNSQTGRWVSVYDGATFTNAGKLDVDHVVALAEAWDSGAFRWDSARREAFANDLESPWSLVAVSARSNRAKSDRDVASWLPASNRGRCFLAAATVITKWRWSLTVDQAELEVLRRELRRCAPLVVEVEQIAGPEQESATPAIAVDGLGSAAPTGVAPLQNGECPPSHAVKGNMPSMIFHLPGSRWYNATRAERCFLDTPAALNAGFRSAQG